MNKLRITLPNKRVPEACLNNSNEFSDIVRMYFEGVSKNDDKTISEYANRLDVSGAWDYEYKVKEVLSKLEITDFDEKMKNLSGGQT